MKKSGLNPAFAASGSAMVLTIMMIVLITLELAIVSLVATRGLSEEGLLQSQNISARRAAEVAINRLNDSLYTYMQSNSAASAKTNFAKGGSNDLDETTLQTTNPETGVAENTLVTISAWVASDSRNNYFHIVGRAKIPQNGIDLLVHRWVYVYPCTNGSALTTLVSSTNYPGYYYGMAAFPNGRVFFGTNYAGGASSFLTWHKDTGLSTLVTGDNLGIDTHILADSKNSRIFFSENKGAGNAGGAFVWSESTGLSLIATDDFTDMKTVFTAFETPSAGVADDGRLYFGSNSGNFFSWKEGSGLTTIVTGHTRTGTITTRVHAASGRVYFGEIEGSGSFWTWSPSTGLTTIFNESLAWQPQVAISPDGKQVYLGEYSATGKFFAWNTRGVLTTILSSSPYPGYTSLVVDPESGRIFFGNYLGGGGANNNFYTWKSGQLSTLLAGVTYPGYNSTAISANGRVFIGQSDSSASLWTWKDGVLSTIVSGQSNPGVLSLRVDPNGRAFWGNYTTSESFFTWSETTGLSTLVTGPDHPGGYSTRVRSDGRVFFGGHTGVGGLWTWKQGVGLSTILNNSYTYMAYHSGAVSDSGPFLIGRASSISPVWVWTDDAGCSVR